MFHRRSDPARFCHVIVIIIIAFGVEPNRDAIPQTWFFASAKKLRIELMGGNNSKEDNNNWRQNSSVRSSSSASSWGSYPDPQSGYGHGGYAYEPQQPSYPTQQPYYAQPPPPPPNYGNEPQPHASGRVAGHRNEKRLDRKYSRITDNYNSIDEVTEALARAGLESSNLILGIDFTKSNEWTGKHSFNRKSLHHIGNGPNPYEQAISIIGKTLAAFDEDNLIPCFGFGDASTHDQDVFSFYPDERICNGFEEVLSRYREIVPIIRLAGPTSFAPIVEMAMTIVEQTGGQYHVLVIVADGQVTRSIDTEHGRLSPQEQSTVDAIVEASKFPLSIILVGVGDGPWDMMKEFDDNIPARVFDNFQHLWAFQNLMVQHLLALQNPMVQHPLMPQNLMVQHLLAVQNLLMLLALSRVPLLIMTTRTLLAQLLLPQLCPICLTNSKDMAFGCGHQTCCECGQDLQSCPICRSPINTRIKLY
ncbi:E3 ubiquitin-protein ligase RGLG1 [Glycine max]|nr:E3 ubiquitin-protein ligase RGLG1 [Glycine max]